MNDSLLIEAAILFIRDGELSPQYGVDLFLNDPTNRCSSKELWTDLCLASQNILSEAIFAGEIR